MKRTKRRSTIRTVFFFWVIIGLLSLVLAVGGFAAGRYWVGNIVNPTTIDTGAPTISVETLGDEVEEDGSGQASTPPDEIQVAIDERQPSPGERAEIEDGGPQDGAELSREERGMPVARDESVGSDDKPIGQQEEAQRPAPAAGKKFAVISGAFGTEVNARRQADKLRSLGYHPIVTEVKTDTGTVHRVSVGEFADRDEATRLRDRLREEGLEAAVVNR